MANSLHYDAETAKVKAFLAKGSRYLNCVTSTDPDLRRCTIGVEGLLSERVILILPVLIVCAVSD